MAASFIKILKRKLNSAFYVALRWVNYYPYYDYLHGRGQKINLTPEYEIELTAEEKAFLKLCAASYNYFESDYALGHRQKELSLYKLQDVTFFSHTGVIMINQKLIVESGLSVDRLTRSKAFRDFTLMLPSRLKKGIYTTIQHSHWADNNISLWFIDSLPRAYILANTVQEPVTLLMWKGAHAYQKHTLEFLLKDYPHIKIKYISKHHKIRISNFYLPSFVTASFSGYLPPDVSNWLREKVWQSYAIKRDNPKQRIYISRSKARFRRVLNETDLYPVLKKFGFKIVWPEDLDYGQQIQLFFDAEAIISPHGAGLTNILFAEKCKVVEFHPAKIVKGRYMLLCKGLGFDYTPIIGSKGDEIEDFTIPVTEVENWLTSQYNLIPS
ncbi:glycosyltransferase family 61 protein [Pontibacter arcticus]|uniref:Glycosyltransferase family 61 protein n=1 Tax=Pontibacter arcticus TaxID=2080288 RepID=A0A364RI73_9BACT|nr:glycosyltransferase family 61 protein [Pontibacter arcticus]RAU83975.1 glycosyltransferase family 61 protein [Pontibacter arcticus]